MNSNPHFFLHRCYTELETYLADILHTYMHRVLGEQEAQNPTIPDAMNIIAFHIPHPIPVPGPQRTQHPTIPHTICEMLIIMKNIFDFLSF